MELLILPRSWILANHAHHKALALIINKLYSKPMHRFGIITSPRVKNEATFIDDFSFGLKKEATLYLLLGPDRAFQQMRDDGITRDFDSGIDSLDQAFDCDIPEKYHPMFPLTQITEVHCADDFELTPEVMNRVVGTAGYKSLDDGRYELTAYTSFMRGLGPRLIDITAQHFLRSLNKPSFVVVAEVIVQHNLVKYYTDKCGFVKSSRPDVWVKTSSGGDVIDSPLENGILATRDFSLASLERTITGDTSSQ